MEPTTTQPKKKRLSYKEKGFAKDIADGKNGTQAILANYDTKDPKVASVMAVENLRKPRIQEELKKLGFDSDNAKSVVAEILNKPFAEDRDRLKAAGMIFEVNGDYAPEKSITVNFQADEEALKEIISSLRAKIA